MALNIFVTFNKTPNGTPLWGFSCNGIASKNFPVQGSQQINWIISNASEPGTNWAGPGIHFTPTTNTPALWPNSQPALNGNNNQYQVQDNMSGGTTAYNYTVSIQTPLNIYSTDPDLTNDPPNE